MIAVQERSQRVYSTVGLVSGFSSNLVRRTARRAWLCVFINPYESEREEGEPPIGGVALSSTKIGSPSPPVFLSYTYAPHTSPNYSLRATRCVTPELPSRRRRLRRAASLRAARAPPARLSARSPVQPVTTSHPRPRSHPNTAEYGPQLAAQYSSILTPPEYSCKQLITHQLVKQR